MTHSRLALPALLMLLARHVHHAAAKHRSQAGARTSPSEPPRFRRLRSVMAAALAPDAAAPWFLSVSDCGGGSAYLGKVFSARPAHGGGEGALRCSGAARSDDASK